MINCKFEKMQLSNLDNIMKLHKELLIFEKQFDKTIDLEWDYKSYLEEKIKDNHCIKEMVTVNNEIISYFIASIKKEEEYRTIKCTLELEEIYIVERYRQKGIGAQILDKLKHIAKIMDVPISVKISANNKHALDFYRKMGLNEYEIVMELDS
jgi:predicted acetyltransferase